MGTVQSPAARKDRLDTRYCDREGREFQETHQLQTLRVCSSRVYKKIQILDSSTSFVKEVYTKMYSIYTVARTTPSSQMLLYSSLCTKRKKKKKNRVCSGAARRLESQSTVQTCTNQCARNGGVQQKATQGYREERGVLGNDGKTWSEVTN